LVRGPHGNARLRELFHLVGRVAPAGLAQAPR
jgi:hypothetical protein